MNKRLAAISEFIGEKGFADVGTDHGYLPLYMLEKGYEGQIVASDINADPLELARSNARHAGFEDKIRFILCDGLDDYCIDRVDTIVVAGMGGDTICGILDRAEWCMDSAYKLILQPMTKPEILRFWLSYNDFEITDELVVEDNGWIYQIICARYGSRVTLNDAELFTGRYELAKDSPYFPGILDKNIRRFEKLIHGLENSADAEDISRLRFSRGVLDQLYDMKKAYSDGGTIK